MTPELADHTFPAGSSQSGGVDLLVPVGVEGLEPSRIRLKGGRSAS